jgi:nucleoside-diphosphate-sugar epimerase
MKDNILITGSAGFIGSRLVEVLHEKGYNIIGLDLARPKTNSDSHRNRIQHFEADISEASRLPAGLPRNVSILVHAAALVHQTSQDLSRENYFKVNHLGTKNILAALDTDALKHVIFLSTVSVYGKIPPHISPDESTPPYPLDFYGESKLAAEKEIIAFADLHKIPYTILQLVPVYGKEFLLNLNKRIFLPKRIGFYKISSGKQRISLCSVDNVAKALLHCLNHSACFNQTFIIKDNKDYTLREVISFYKDNLGFQKKPVFIIPKAIPRLALPFIRMLFPRKGVYLAYQMSKILDDNTYSDHKISQTGIDLDGNLKNTLA